MVVKVEQKPPVDPKFDATVASSVVKVTQQATEDAEQFLNIVSAFPIETAEEYESAMAERRKAKEEWDRLEARRTSITGPLNAALKGVNDLFRPPLDLLKRVWETIDTNAKPYLFAVREKQRKEEEERQAELRKLQAKEEKAEAAGNETKVEQIQAQASVVASAPLATEAPKAAGTSYKPKWAYVITDLPMLIAAALDGQVPYELKSPVGTDPFSGDVVINIKVGKAVSLNGDKTKIAGVRAVEDLSISSRRK